MDDTETAFHSKRAAKVKETLINAFETLISAINK